MLEVLFVLKYRHALFTWQNGLSAVKWVYSHKKGGILGNKYSHSS